MTLTLWVLVATTIISVLTFVAAVRLKKQRATVIFVGLGVMLVVLTGGAAGADSTGRDYLAIQDQYKADHPVKAPAVAPDTKVIEFFPAFPEAKVGTVYKTERCISCHVPDLTTISPQLAADHLSADFFKYEPDAKGIASREHLQSTATKSAHPSEINAGYYQVYGETAGFVPYTSTGTDPATGQDATTVTKLAGPIPSFLNPVNNGGKAWTIDQVGCIVCHNGSRLALTQTGAHTNLIINPEYDWSAGADLYYKNCVSCHGALGQGGIGPPLSNQDRLGFFNEDYYYRCIEYGYTGFEHIGSVMPAWGAAAPDWTYDAARDKAGAHGRAKVTRQLSENEIHMLSEFIRHWEKYQTLP